MSGAVRGRRRDCDIAGNVEGGAAAGGRSAVQGDHGEEQDHGEGGGSWTSSRGWDGSNGTARKGERRSSVRFWVVVRFAPLKGLVIGFGTGAQEV